MTALKQIQYIAAKLDEEREHVAAVRDHLAVCQASERDSISYENLTKASDLGRHISARLAALIDSLKDMQVA